MYDFVIIGGGSAGAVLDAFPSVAYFKTDWHWRELRVHYESLTSNRPQSFVSRRYEQAKIMGGGSSINRMMTIRGLPWDFDWVRENACGGWHASGTCRIGSEDDPYAVVDPSCRVIGVRSLRVVDASVMPGVVSANTNLTTIMIAEKASDAMAADAE